ncbi:MAG: hypothetical protein J1D87_04435 [Lachnospiraceae bacterium]|nr:hypothetical protein [Lachnospiraceae bacterium]
MFRSKKRTNLEKRERAEVFFNRFSLILVAVLLILLGVGLVFLSVDIKNNSNHLLYNYADAISSVGQILLALSLSSLMVEWFGYVNYTRKRICEVLAENDVLNVLDIKRKKELKSALISNIYMPDKKLGDNNIVNVLDAEFDNILKDYFYEEYIVYVDYNIVEIEEKKYIEKIIRRTSTVSTINGQETFFSNVLDIMAQPVLGEKTVQLEFLKINNKIIKDIDISSEDVNEEAGHNYSKRFYIDTNPIENKLHFVDKLDIDVLYKTYVSINDRVYTHRVSKPCKHYCIHLNVHNPEYDITVLGFGFMSLGNKNRRRVVKSKTGCMLRFLDWILPGDGVTAVLLDYDTDKCNIEIQDTDCDGKQDSNCEKKQDNG